MVMREYLEVLREQIRCVKVRDLVEDEVKGHIEDQAEAFVKAGMEEEKALLEAVRQMGDPVEAGVALDRVHRPSMDWKLVILVALLSGASLVIQYGLCRGSGELGPFWSQCVYRGAAILIMCGVCLADYSVIGKYAVWMWGILSAGFLLVILWGPLINGRHLYAKNYMYLYVPVFAGILYRYRGGGYGALFKCAVFHGAAMLLGLSAFSLPVCLDVTAIALILASVGIWKGWFAVRRKTVLAVIWAAAVLVPLFALMTGRLWMKSYQIARIQGVLNPWKNPTGSGYTATIVRTALKDSHWIGGAGRSLEGWLEGLNTDYVLIHLVSYYGRIAVVLLLVLLGIFLSHSICSVVRQKNQLGQMVGIGCCLVFGIQIAHYVMLNLGVGFMALGMPFVSGGSSPVITTYVLTGLLLSIYRYKNISPERGDARRGRDQIRIEKADGYRR